ncbi:ABC transporter substrate-binding protein [Sulfitobacter guttiformis]|uniref:Peptide/nickel transport system substrate-binding protein n=1 Tax=Sulfitobacter guttiformis TaxID=74349 RepID=A0A420DU34_9RHOB|nr:ABC transporter substrate-binding protein [Sulfitobacter guttiformis]KIN71188.1 Extracellular solute-binding protein, family 5 [Sulfitobacter guttiformis KCTC 32187]RKE97659.1 peptide/nickel transport system substrate-binding protein [Sulfitobacter guttiformis]
MHKIIYLAAALTLLTLPVLAQNELVQVAPAQATAVSESSFWATEVRDGILPPAALRIPQEPLIVDLEAKGRTSGVQGGTLRTLVSRSKDIRQMVVYGYARLVGYAPDYSLQPDLLRAVDVLDDRRYTLHLRKGHRWSDGAPFTSADFAYWWNDVANNALITPSGPPEWMSIDGKMGTVTFPDAHTVVFEWEIPNSSFLPLLAQASPPFIYRPSHYLKQYHGDYADPNTLIQEIQAARVKSWPALHNKRDNMYKFDNPDEPTLQPWMNASGRPTSRNLFVRNPYFHRVDTKGTQLPYIDVVEMTVVGGGLVAAKANAGEVDLQARGLDFRDVAILKKGELEGGNYRTLLWANGAASQIAIYPNLNFRDPVWREVMRDVRFRRALSLGIDRRMINRALYFGIADEGGMTALSQSPLFDPDDLNAWSHMDIAHGNRLLDEMGLTERMPNGIRKLPDGRPMEFVIETAGERQEEENALTIITDTWRDLGIRLIMRPLDRDILRNRIYAGTGMAAVWYGWDNGLPSASTSPSYLAPTQQEFFAWPKWGQYYQTKGQAGEAPDMEAPKRLLDLQYEWDMTSDLAKRTAIWDEMLDIHAQQQFAIGVLSGAPQPVVVSRRLRNVPEKGIWAYDPGGHFGIHRIDEFYFEDAFQQVSQ